MKAYRKRLAATSAVLALLATTATSGAVLAQGAKAPAQEANAPAANAAKPAQEGQPQARSEQQERDAAQAGNPSETAGTQMRAVSDLKDMDVYNVGGNEIGEVRNVLIGPDNKIQIVVEYGGFLGVGERQVSLPLNHFEVRDDRLVINGPSDEELKGFPAYTGPQQGQSDAKADQRVALVVFVVPARAVADAADEKRAFPVSDLMDREVYNLAGEQIGDVERVLKGESDRLFVVVGHGGFLSVGEKQILLPMERLKLRDDRLVISGLTDREVQAMPEFKPDGRDFRELNGADNAELTVHPR